MALITTETARIMAAKSVQARKDAANRKEAAPVQTPVPTEQQAGDYLQDRLSRVRLQLDKIDKMMMTETDPQKLDRLASAQARLAEQERLLSGRPLPGSLKPSSRQQSKQPRIEPLPDEPACGLNTTTGSISPGPQKPSTPQV